MYSRETRSSFPILEEEVVNVKDAVTSGLLAHGPVEGMEAGGSSERPGMPKFKSIEGYVAEDVGTKEVGKMAFVPQNPEKGRLSIGSMVDQDGSQRVSRYLLEKRYFWWANLQKCRGPPQGFRTPYY